MLNRSSRVYYPSEGTCPSFVGNDRKQQVLMNIDNFDIDHHVNQHYVLCTNLNYGQDSIKIVEFRILERYKVNWFRHDVAPPGTRFLLPLEPFMILKFPAAIILKPFNILPWDQHTEILSWNSSLLMHAGISKFSLEPSFWRHLFQRQFWRCYARNSRSGWQSNGKKLYSCIKTIRKSDG